MPRRDGGERALARDAATAHKAGMGASAIWGMAGIAMAMLVAAPAQAPLGQAGRRPPPPAPTTPAPAPAPTLVVKRVLPVGSLKFGEWHWDEAGAPAAGPLIVTVDLEAQVLSVFRGGYEIGATAILYGTDDTPTPLGAFPITQKDAKHVSTIYGAPMPYMLRLTNDGISVHGSEVAWGWATHGCIGVPVAFAKRLFGVAKLGDVVIITRGKTLAMGQPLAV